MTPPSALLCVEKQGNQHCISKEEIFYHQDCTVFERIIFSSWYLHNRKFLGLLLRGTAGNLGYNHENPPIHLDRGT